MANDVGNDIRIAMCGSMHVRDALTDAGMLFRRTTVVALSMVLIRRCLTLLRAQRRLQGQKLELFAPTAYHHRHPPHLILRWRHPGIAGGLAAVSVPLVACGDVR